MSPTLSGAATYTIPLQFKLEADFATADAHVYTSSVPPETHQWSPLDNESTQPSAPNGYLIINLHSDLDKIDSVSENARYARPRLLVLLGAITFLTDEPLTPFDITVSSYKEHTPQPSLVSNNKLISETGDHSKSLSHLLPAITSTNPGARLLVASLLDRWRKARWMQAEEESHLYADEAFLSFFHILELLAKEYDKGLTEQIKTDIESFLTRLLERTLKHRGPRLQQLKGEKFKSVKSAVTDHIPIASRICHFLEHRPI
ncbi:hypothetical protein CYFUS_007223 [Cystobacter fuscus]|uniref:Uncharacterized protein n=1 Tax=Cystobacter fuscus TaxID=43 RepID=A0A250JDP8_9BACT|nr:hypothetical protein [Cystobacter fuscus]ATB41753.1 hypothetical protein CYFUS_007223 [Cystobacter fuscus]